MAVGAGSIKRAAKAKVESAEKKVEAKKPVAKKTTATKKAVEKLKVVEKKEPGVTVVKKEINQVCHLTEDLPIYLL